MLPLPFPFPQAKGVLKGFDREETTVDGRNPAPPGMEKTYLSTGAGFLPSTVVYEGCVSKMC